MNRSETLSRANVVSVVKRQQDPVLLQPCMARLSGRYKNYLSLCVEPRMDDERYMRSQTVADGFFVLPPHRELIFEVLKRGDGFDKRVVEVFLERWNLNMRLSFMDIEIVSGNFRHVRKDPGYCLGRRNSYRPGGWPIPPKTLDQLPS